MRNIILAAVAFAALASGDAAMADDFNGQQPPQAQPAINAYLDHQATVNQFADPTAPNSIRDHGHP